MGLSIELPDFTPWQVQDLASRYQLDWETREVERLMGLVGGNPYLVQIALHHISGKDITLKQLLETATSDDGIYRGYLRNQLWNIQKYPELVTALTQVVMSPTPVKLNPIEAFKLHSMGLVRFVQGQVVPSGDLCRRYFSDRLSQWQLNLLQEHRLATIVSINVVNFTGMMATDSEKTQNLLYQNFQFITQLGKQYEGQFLKSTEDGLLIYFPSTIDAVNCAQEIQLAFRQIAEATSEPILTYRIGIHLGDVIFNCKDVTGPGVTIATRLQTEIPAGDICISQTVYEAVRSHLPLQPIEIGQEQFEGIEEPMSVYQLTL